MQEDKKCHWMLVAKDLKHLAEVQPSGKTWWCVPAQCSIGDRAFVYKPKVGIVLYLQIGPRSAGNQDFCEQFRLSTASVQVLKVFDPPITVRLLRTGLKLQSETFLRRQFQGSSFKFGSEDSVEEIVRLSTETFDT